MCGGGKKQAKAITKTAAAQALQDRYAAQGSELALEASIAQDKAGKTAAEVLNKPVENIDVSLAPDTPAAEIDPVTQRRRTVRSSFTGNTPSSGIKI